MREGPRAEPTRRRSRWSPARRSPSWTRNRPSWIDAGRYHAGLNPRLFQIPSADGLVEWFERLLDEPASEDELWLVAEVDGQAEAWAQAKGATLAYLDTYLASPQSVPFYEQRTGYEQSSVIFRKWLA